MSLPEAAPPALAVSALSHSFGSRRALDQVGFTLQAGAFAVLLGPNGAGKTTLISLLTGLYAARHGEIAIFSHSMRRRPMWALEELGVVFQSPTLDLDLSVAENLAYHGALRGLPRREALARAHDELNRMGMADRMSEKMRGLSGGLRRRAEIARALLHRPRLLLVDEGTAGLDVAARQALLGHVRGLCAERGLAVLWATHLLDEVEPTDTLLLLHDGTLRWAGAASGLAPGEPLAEAFLRITGERA